MRASDYFCPSCFGLACCFSAEAVSSQPHNEVTWAVITKQVKAVRSCRELCTKLKESSLIQNFSLKSKVAAKKKGRQGPGRRLPVCSPTPSTSVLSLKMCHLRNHSLDGSTEHHAKQVWWPIIDRRCLLSQF